MSPFLPTFILRHRKENLRKCTLEPLKSRSDLSFFTYPKDPLPTLENYIVLTLDAPPLTPEDHPFGLLIIDGTWRYAEQMSKSLKPPFIPRSLPGRFRTASPRKQNDCSDPDRGLASIEALYAAYSLLGRDITGLLDHYYWKDRFLELNYAVFI